MKTEDIMAKMHNPTLLPLARALRKNMTKEERHLWYDFLSSYPVRFKRQQIVGRYIVDFYCPQARLVIELDGSQHYEGDGPEKDAQRTAELEKQGLTVLRFLNYDIQTNFRGVCLTIDATVRGVTDSIQT